MHTFDAQCNQYTWISEPSNQSSMDMQTPTVGASPPHFRPQWTPSPREFPQFLLIAFTASRVGEIVRYPYHDCPGPIGTSVGAVLPSEDGRSFFQKLEENVERRMNISVADEPTLWVHALENLF